MAGIYISLPFMVPDSNCTTGVFVARSAHTRAVLEALYTDPIKSNLEQRRLVEYSLEELRRSGNRLRSRKMTDGNGLTYFDGRIIILEAVQQIMAERVASSSLAFLTAVSRQLR
jgi:hypothetical protein